MTRPKVFLLFSTGIIAGGGAVALVMNYYFNSPVKTVQKKATPTKEIVSDSKIKSKLVPTDSIGNYLDKKLPIAIKGDTSSDFYKHIDENSKVYDSLKGIRDNAEININRDVLVATRRLKYKIVSTEKVSPEDSVLQEMTSIRNTKVSAIEVEFWQSPINYKGYKLGRNKLVIFGIDPNEEILLFDCNDYVILQAGNMYYRLDRTSEFRNLKKFTDSSVISRLN